MALRVVDLPGTYSLTSWSLEERIARAALIDEAPDLVVNILDASSLERNLYLTTQLMELGLPIVLAFNMSDIVRARGEKVDLPRLSRLLGIPIVETVGSRGEGVAELLDAVLAAAREKRRPVSMHYGNEVEEEIARLASGLETTREAGIRVSARWTALKLIENDPELRERQSAEVLAAADASRAHLEKIFGEQPEMVIAEQRYGFISGACQECVSNTVEFRHTVSDRVDSVVTHPLLGIPLFLLVMYLVFQFTFGVGGPAADLVAWLISRLQALLSPAVLPGMLHSVLVDGVIAGVGGVLTFLPNILLLFLFIAALEDSGCMARAAFVMDHVMHRIGLHGKSFIPMLLGLGCSVPGIMATRVLEDRRDRIATMLVVPLMSCSARLPVYTLLAGAFFAPAMRGRVIFAVYVLGALLAVGLAKLFRRWVVPGPTVPFVMELPPYRVPTVKGLLIHTWARGWLFLRKIGTVVLAASLVIWLLCSFPTPPGAAQMSRAERDTSTLEGSYAADVGKAIAPLLRPIGLGDWKVATSLVVGMGAKELVVSSMSTFYSMRAEDNDPAALGAALRTREAFTPLTALVMMVFVLVYVPCLATVAAIGRESGSWGWAFFQVLYSTGLAWVLCLLIYQGGRLIGVGGG